MKLGGARAQLGCDAATATATSRSPTSRALEDAAPGHAHLPRRSAATRRSWPTTRAVGGHRSARDAPAVAAAVAARRRTRTSPSSHAIELFHPPRRPPAGRPSDRRGRADGADSGAGASIGPHVVVGDGVRDRRATRRCTPRVTLYPDVRIGDDFTAHAGVVVREDVRDRRSGHAARRRGRSAATASAIVPRPGRAAARSRRSGPSCSRTTSRSAPTRPSTARRSGATVIGRGTKIDNLVMVGHGCRIGPGCLLAAQVGLAGGTRARRAACMMGGQVGVGGPPDDRRRRADRRADRRPSATSRPGAIVRRLSRRSRSAPGGASRRPRLRLPELLRRVRRVERRARPRRSDGERRGGLTRRLWRRASRRRYTPRPRRCAAAMKIRSTTSGRSPRQLAYGRTSAELNARLARGAARLRGRRRPRRSTSTLLPGRSRPLLRRATLRGEVPGRVCALPGGVSASRSTRRFAFVLTPRRGGDAARGRAAREDDLGLGFYEGDEIDLTPLVHEQTMLALPTRPLCGEECRGLCPRCGVNLNAGPCACPRRRAATAALRACCRRCCAARSQRRAAEEESTSWQFPSAARRRRKRDKRRAHDALQRAARDRVSAVRRAHAAPSRLPALRHVPRPQGRRGRRKR